MPILGIDEVGRGPWAGPLVIGAVVLPDRFDQDGEEIGSESWQNDLADSKKLTVKKRKKLSPIILEKAVATGLGWVSSAELDQVGLAKALRLAARRAVYNLLNSFDKSSCDTHHDSSDESSHNSRYESSADLLHNLPKKLPFSEIIIDGTGNFLEDTPLENMVSVLPKADAKIKEVSAASIIAKVARDDYMIKLAEQYPDYGFEKHVGYGTAAHKAALEKLGPCPEHRFSFAPVARLAVRKNAPGSAPTIVSGNTPVVASGSTSMTTRDVNACTVADGRHAESIVADYLKKQGHKILARNYKTKFYEIDIVSATKDHVYFTEVKYRKNNSHGDPLEFIDKAKQRQIAFAAEAFMESLSQKLNRSLDDLPSPILAGASVSGPSFNLDKWLEIML